MAHFAQIDSNNIVTQVIVVADADTADAQGNHMESIGLAFCQRLIGGNWKQTSYNTHGGVHALGGTPFRKNYAGLGYTYDANRDAFIPSKPYESWVLNESSCLWDSPIPYPTDVGTPEASKRYTWNESTKAWDLVA
jgi:hypothetical protein